MRRLASILAGALAMALPLAAPAAAEIGIEDAEFSVAGTQAGIHPDEVVTTIRMNTLVDEEAGVEIPDEALRDLEVDLPPGFAGDPLAVPSCEMEKFITAFDSIGHNSCPSSSAVGYIGLKLDFDPFPVGVRKYIYAPVYNLVPSPGEAAKIGFLVLGLPVVVDVGVREAPPHNIYADLGNISQAAFFYESRLTLWGNPASAEHDKLRGRCLDVIEFVEPGSPISLGACKANTEERPFLTAPRACEGPLPVSFLGTAWNSGNKATASTTTAGRGGCGKLGFVADADAAPTTTAAESATGLNFELNIDDEGLVSPKAGAIAFSDIKSARVTLPSGVTLNPSQAEGLGTCGQAQLALESAASPFGAGCPASSRIGSVEVETPLLEGKVLHGSMFVATPYQNPFGSLIALYMVIKSSELGIAVKIPARVDTDQNSGQIVTTFGHPSASEPGLRTLPQIPLGAVRVNLRAGGRSPLVTPPICGAYRIDSTFTPWANPGNPYSVESTFQVTSGPNGAPCPGPVPPFAPTFEAGSVNNDAGAYSPLVMRLTRNDGDQDLTRFDAVLPPGLVPKLAGVPGCPEAAIAAAKVRSGTQELLAPSCPPASRIGRVEAAAGVGGSLTWVHGTAYLAGPYGGAPLSVVVVTPAVAGPFDVGTVVVREAIDINPTTYLGEIDGAASDPIPHILQGIPLKLRELRVYIDRPEFIRNPTSCDLKATVATIFGSFANPFTPADDVPVARASRYQAASCQSLPFKPKLWLKLKGPTKRTGHTALRSVLTARPGDANLSRAVVTLPPSQFIDNARIANPCTRVQFNLGACPKRSILGRARAFTPLLDEPLEGPIYFRSNGGARELPDVVLDLRGQFRILAVGYIGSKKARIRTTFASIPDAPVRKIVLNFYGGKRGLLQNSEHLCRGKQRANVGLRAQNGVRDDYKVRVRTSCRKKSKRQKRAAHQRAR